MIDEPHTAADATSLRPCPYLEQWWEGVRAGRGFLAIEIPSDWTPTRINVDGGVDVYRNAEGWVFAVGRHPNGYAPWAIAMEGLPA